MTERLDWLRQELAGLDHTDLLRARRRFTSLADAWCGVDNRRLRNFAGNDYLNLAHDRRLVEAAQLAAEAAGTGSGASALVTGRTDRHAELEQRLAQFEHQAAAILFPSGYAANVGTISAFAAAGDVIFSDRLNHASLVDGCRLSGARIHVYEHLDLEDLSDALCKAGDFRRRLIVTDSVFSMDGDAAPLNRLCDLAEQHDALLIVDEAHATGLFGENGRGLAEALGVEDRVDVRIGTLSKALGSLGGFVSGSQVLVDWLWNKARTQTFSTALPPPACAAASAALDIVEAEPWRREHVLELAGRLRGHLESAGLPLVPHGVGPILPVVLNDSRTVITAADELEQRGYLVAAIRPPSVPDGSARLRITINCAHSAEDIDRLAETLCDVLSSYTQVHPQPASNR